MSSTRKLLVSPSPHIHSGDSIEKNMYAVILALMPAWIVSIYYFGLDALWVTLTSIFACVIIEWFITRFMLGKKELTITDGSAILTGLLLAMNLPSSIPLWIVVVGALVAIGIGKMSYGGLGNNIFNPAIVGRVMLIISFPQQMTSYPPSRFAETAIDAVSAPTPLGIAKGIIHGTNTMDQMPSAIESLLGQTGGSFGEVSAIALLLGFIFLMIRKVVTWHTPVAIFVTAYVFGGIMHLVNPEIYIDPINHLLTGGMMLGALYMATDYVTSPMSKGGMILFGFFIGLITMLIRLFGSYPEGISFAILFMNGITPIINRYMTPRVFGDKAAKTPKVA